MHTTAAEHSCAHCNHAGGPAETPSTEADWRAEAPHHAPWCAWLNTRAWSRPDPYMALAVRTYGMLAMLSYDTTGQTLKPIAAARLDRQDLRGAIARHLTDPRARRTVLTAFASLADPTRPRWRLELETDARGFVRWCVCLARVASARTYYVQRGPFLGACN